MRGELLIDKALFEAFLIDRNIKTSEDLSIVKDLKNIKPINLASKSDISFCRFEGKNGLEIIKESSAGLIFIPKSLKELCDSTETLLLPCNYPRLEILKLISKFWNHNGNNENYDFSNNKCIHNDSIISKNVEVGPYTIIEAGVEIGDGCKIGPNCHLSNVSIGCNAKIGSSVTIGGSGYGFEDDPETGEVLDFPHIGEIKIGNNVSIGSNTCIDRGAIGDTVIGNDVKIDNLVHIAHNVNIGNRCKIIALAMIGGSVTIEDDCWISPSSSIRDWRKISEGALVGLGAVVTKDIEAKAIVVGNPAKSINTKVGRYK